MPISCVMLGESVVKSNLDIYTKQKTPEMGSLLLNGLKKLPQILPQVKKKPLKVNAVKGSCDPDWIRTNDPQLRRLVLYPAELPGRYSVYFIKKRLTEEFRSSGC